MASIADMVAGDAIQSAGQTVDIGGAMDKGAQLAQTVQSIQAKRLEMEQSKQQLELAKYGKVAQLYEVGNQMPEGPARTSYLNKFVPNAIQGLGMGDKIHPVVQDMLTKDPAAAGYMQQQVQSGMMSPGQAAQALSDPEHFSSVYTKSNIDQFKGQQATAAMPTDLPPTPPSYQGTDKQIMAAKGNLNSLLSEGKITMRDIYAAQSDPDKMKSLLRGTGLDQMGGEEALNDVLQTYPKTLAEAEKVGIGHKDAMLMASMRADPYTKRITQQAQLDAQHAVTKDTALNTYNQRAEGALRIGDLAHAAMTETDPKKKIARTNQMLGQLSAEEAALETGKNNFSEGSQDRVAITDARARVAKIYDDIKGGVTDVKTLDVKLQNALNTINNLGGSYKTAINARFDQITAGALPDQQPIFDSKRAAFEKRFGDKFQAPAPTQIQYKGKSYTPDQIKQAIQNTPGLKDTLPTDLLRQAGIVQ